MTRKPLENPRINPVRLVIGLATHICGIHTLEWTNNPIITHNIRPPRDTFKWLSVSIKHSDHSLYLNNQIQTRHCAQRSLYWNRPHFKSLKSRSRPCILHHQVIPRIIACSCRMNAHEPILGPCNVETIQFFTSQSSQVPSF